MTPDLAKRVETFEARGERAFAIAYPIATADLVNMLIAALRAAEKRPDVAKMRRLLRTGPQRP